MSRNNPEMQQVQLLKFYRLTLLTDPERQEKNPVSRKLILQKKIKLNSFQYQIIIKVYKKNIIDND